MATKPQKPYPDFPLFAHSNGQWAKKIKGKLIYFGLWNDPDSALAKYQAFAEDGVSFSSPTGKGKRPRQPRPDFPLRPHATGKWYVYIRGKCHYFGTWNDPDGALQEYMDVKDDLMAGRSVTRAGGVTIRELCNRFLASKQKRIDSGELTQRTWDDYHHACSKIIKVFGKGAKVANLRPVDFEELRSFLWQGEKRKNSPITVSNYIGRIRSVFKYAVTQKLIPGTIHYGDSFNKPSAKMLRKAKLTNGKKMFEASEIKKMLAIAPPQMKAMILLGINCGFGNTDCANLYPSSIQGTWARLPRSKTAIQRHCPLWPETLEALDNFPWGETYVFTTRKGNSWGPKSKVDDPIASEMRKLMKKAHVYRKGRGFYALRHTFNTIGLRTKDTLAVKYIMGHTPNVNDMTANYNQEAPPDEDLLAVATYVRKWLFG